MAIGILRPVGERAPLFQGASCRHPWPSGYTITWLESGTAALALALRVVVRSKGAPKPEVIVPAYACPDLISATLWAGATPVVVDTRMGSPWLSEAGVEGSLSDSTVAIVVPHFLGIRHPVSDWTIRCRDRGVMVVDDSAQLSLCSPAFVVSSDLVVLSFGRGKPIPVRGGALLWRSEMEAVVRRELADLGSRDESASQWRIAGALQNVAMTRIGYGAARLLPGLGIGATRYRPLRGVRRLTGGGRKLAEGVIARWNANPLPTQTALQSIVQRTNFVDLPGLLGWTRDTPLLRYPVLAADATVRDSVVRWLVARGIGASAFYGAPLPELRDMPQLGGCAPFPNAKSFARRLFTLPAHTGVSVADLDVMATALHRASARTL